MLITHDMESLRKLCTRAVWIDGGVSRLSGSVDEVERAVRGEAHETNLADFFPGVQEHTTVGG